MRELYITLPERLILEVIQRNQPHFHQLLSLLKMDEKVLLKILSSLLGKGLILFTRDKTYQLSKSMNAEMRSLLKDNHSHLLEMDFLMKRVLQSRLFKNEVNAFNVKKISMTDREYKIYRGLLYNLETFLSDLEGKSFQKENNQIIYWGERSYAEAINDCFNF